MNHLKWMGHAGTVMEIQRNLRQDVQTCDVLICAKEAAIQAHRFVLCSCSDYFRNIFRDVPSDKETTILIPDLKSNILERVLTFIYLGEVCVNSSQLSDFLESINFLGIKSPISFECHLNKEEKVCEQAEDDLINNEDKDNDEAVSTATETCGGKDFEYLEVYNEDEKIDQYAIEHIETEGNNDYILGESAGHNTFQLTNDIKVSSHNDCLRTDTEREKELVTLGTEDQLSFKNDEKVICTINKEKVKEERYLNETAQLRNESLEKAIKSVIDEGMSLQKAANTYQISKTVLWRRVRKHPDYKLKGNPLINAAVEKLAQGETLKSVSIELDIPLSTLHRHKMKLFHEGRLPGNIQIRKKDSKESLKMRLNDAVKACQEGMSQNHASTVFAVPKSTLWRHIKKINRLLLKKDEINMEIIKVDQQSEVEDDASFIN